MTEKQYEEFHQLEEKILEMLEQAVNGREAPESECGKQIASLHKKWISMVWSNYSSKAHKGVAQIYLIDDHFQAYYDRNVEGCAQFLQNSIGH